jgi:hypothetical protein
MNHHFGNLQIVIKSNLPYRLMDEKHGMQKHMSERR